MKKIRCNRKMFMYVAKVVVTCLVPGMIFTGCNKPVGGETGMELSPQTLDFTWSGGEQSFTITSNAEWSVSSSDAPKWLTVSPTGGSESGTVIVTADENISATQRTATITVKATGVTRTIDVTQVGVHLSEPEMVLVRSGTFTMGCASTEESDCREEETPAHRVTFSSDFYIGKYEITQAQWKAVMEDNPSRVKGDNLPVEGVTWNEVQTFIAKLNRITGKQYRLPTEAEWEYAARGGNSSMGYRYSGSNTIGNVAWYRENSNNTTHAVGTKSPNELGIYDMSGNVSEWCSDWYGVYNSSAQTNPQGPASGTIRVFRDGSWENPARDARVYARNGNVTNNRDYALGFRVAL